MNILNLAAPAALWAAAAVLSVGPAAAKGPQSPERIGSPSAEGAPDSEFTAKEIVEEVRSAENSNLERAMSNGMKDAKAAAANVLALADLGRASVKGAAADLGAVVRKSGDARDWLENLSLSADLLESKAAAFREKADAADLETADLEEEALTRRKAAYRAPDRRADHKLAEKYFKEALKKRKGKHPPLGEPAMAVLSAANDIVSEMQSARDHLQKLLNTLDPKGPAALKASKRLAKLSGEAQLVEMEGRLMELGLKMAAYDEDSFESE